MSRRRPWPLVIAVAAATVVAGCGGTDDTTAGHASPRPAASMQAPPDAEGHTDEDHQLPPAEPVPTWDTGSRTSAVRAAEQVMRAFARPTVRAETWWATLQPLLSRSAAIAYQDTDPREVPARRVTGAARLADTSSAYLAAAQVPTDAGTYTVLLVRDGAGAPWLAERITPPESAPR
jgi:hypothetical protein